MDHSSDEKLPAETKLPRNLYSFQALPEATREKLLRLQNSSGDFLKTQAKGPGGRPLTLVILISLLILLTPAFGVVTVLLLPWILYVGWRLRRERRSPIKDFTCLTRTQLIEVSDQTVRCRELKEVTEIKLDELKYGAKSTYFLRMKCADREVFTYDFPMQMFSNVVMNARSWQEKATLWRNEAVAADQRGDTAYFESQEVFRPLAEANLPR